MDSPSFPLFKFLTKKNAKNLLEEGSVRIGTLHDYRDTKNIGTIWDKDEGIKRLILDFGKGQVVNEDMLQRLNIPFRAPNVCMGGKNTFEYDFNAYIYSTTGAFFSDTLIHALEKDKKDACVLIKDYSLFFERISRSESMKANKYLGLGECNYEFGHEFSTLFPIPEEKKENFQKFQKIHPVLLKPKKYSGHREFRAIWASSIPEIKPKTITIPDLSNLCIEIEFDSIIENIELLKNGKESSFGIQIGFTIIKNTGEDASFTIQYPFEIFSPILFSIDGEIYFGLIPSDSSVSPHGASLHGASLMISPWGLIYAPNPIDEIQKIIFFIEDK
jgi:hypothetical protein